MFENFVAYRLICAKPKWGHESQYLIALKHRTLFGLLLSLTPWWQFRKRQRRFLGLLRAIRRMHLHGQDIIGSLNSAE